MDFQSSQDPKQRGILGKHKAYVFGKILERMGNGMTRKRFIKLCMSKGYSRNSAEALAADALADGMSYEQAMETVLWVANTDWAEVGAAISRTIEAIAEAVRKVAIAAGQAIETIGRNIREAVEP